MQSDGAFVKKITAAASLGFELLRSHYRLLLLFVFIAAGWTLLSHLRAKPLYSATAIIGPPPPTPANAMMSMMGAGGETSVAKRLLGGGGQGGNDPYQNFQQIIQSDTLLINLINNDNILPLIFDHRWDARNHRWKEPSFLGKAKAEVARRLHSYVEEEPGIIALRKYLNSNFSLTAAESKSQVSIGLAAMSGSGFYQVQFISDDPRKAERLLGIVIQRADDIVRNALLRDIDARIRYISDELLRSTQAEQRASLIQTLDYQESLKVMLVADKRYSYVLISGPYASLSPVYPKPFLGSLTSSVFLAGLFWAILVLLGYYDPRVRSILRRIEFSG